MNTRLSICVGRNLLRRLLQVNHQPVSPRAILFVAASRNYAANHVQKKFKQPRDNHAVKVKKVADDSDTFGTLAPIPHVSEPVVEDYVDEDDKREETYLSYTDLDRKDARLYAEEIKELIAKRQLKEALLLLEVEMKEKKVKPNNRIFDLLIGGCGRVGYTKKAFQLYNDMKKRGLQPSDGVYTALFNSCANSPWTADGLQRATDLRMQLKEKATLLNRFQYHAMLKAFGRCGDLEIALEVLGDMAKARVMPTAETYSFLLQACISDKTNGFKNAIRVWRQLRASKITPDLFLYNLILRAVRDCGVDKELDVKSYLSSSKTEERLLIDHQNLLEQRQQLVDGEQQNMLRFSARGQQEAQPATPSEAQTISNLPSLELQSSATANLPNLLAEHVNLSANIVALTNLDQPKNRLAILGNLHGFLEQMKLDHVKPDIKTYSQLLECIPSNSSVETALLKHMAETKVKPDVDFFNMLIKKRNFRGDFLGAKQVLGMVRAHNLFPDIATFGVLSLGCSQQQDAEEFLATMDQTGFRVNAQIFGSLLKNAIHASDFYYVIFLMNKAVDWQLPLNEKTIAMLQLFRDTCRENILKNERGQQIAEHYSSSKFRTGFKYFEANFKRWLSKLPADVPEHPWSQYRYKKE